MTIHVALNHVTHYRYDRPVQLGPQVIRLRPAPHCRTRVLSYSLRVEPAKHFIHWQQDPFANHLARLVFPERTREFKVTVDLVAEMSVYNPFDFFLAEDAEQIPFVYPPALAHDLAPYLAKIDATPQFQRLLDSIPREPQPTVNFLVALNQRLQHEIRYLIRMEPGVQTPETTLVNASGSCRDSAWLLVQLLRHLGLAARFVSGYLIQLKADQKALDGPSGTERDFTDLHAWCEVYLPGAGWIGLDPTSGLLAGEGHLPVACTPEPSTAAPIEGLVEFAEVEFSHTMEVTRVHESVRVTRPYTDDQWQAIDALGEQVDQELDRRDVRLTMGGEPTFVSIDARDDPQWNIAALGDDKRRKAGQLARRLMQAWGRGGFLHVGQGKWYPGEPLPRWALSIVWRTDGRPSWRDSNLLDDLRDRPAPAATAADAERFARVLAQRLGLHPNYVQPAYENALDLLAREGGLPLNVDVEDNRLDDPLARERLRRQFREGITRATGWVLPLRRGTRGPDTRWRWISSLWPMRGGRIELLPGDSPMGWRLPLASLPKVEPKDMPLRVEDDPFAPRDALAAEEATAPIGAEPLADAPAQDDPIELTRTALCAQVRDGRLFIYLPPTEAPQDYLDLIAAVEATAAEMQRPLTLEGYLPPRDPRLQLLQVTPDPGVIEVNIHPSKSWKELVERTTALYEMARQTRLATEKFMIDGRHSGTGGGNHLVLGGATAGDSPFLRRPDLLASLLTYWHNHPSLSYLFSGLFIGPTSQAPRIDEARNDQVYELEIALRELDRQLAVEHACPPWLIDRLLRNLLIDMTGNTHRAEFCIDKLYSPDGPTGRLGLLELRAFEMPPHAQMSLAQQVLLRALVAWFWREPYRGRGEQRLTRWGTALHDRFMLPTFIRLDFQDVMHDLRQAGYAFDDGWFEPHFEFRFPAIGDLELEGVQIELRSALEPWHVMGEESAGGGTSRYVDSSLERMELKVTGWNANRHAITCNGATLPLQSTGRAGEYACGVRYRAWQPPAALHPTIGVHAPLTFDVVDRWAGRSIGGCRYHVAHPGGRNHDTFPVNANEAEARRHARFDRIGHTPGPVTVRPAQVSPEFPFTLDLRLA